MSIFIKQFSKNLILHEYTLQIQKKFPGWTGENIE